MSNSNNLMIGQECPDGAACRNRFCVGRHDGPEPDHSWHSTLPWKQPESVQQDYQSSSGPAYSPYEPETSNSLPSSAPVSYSLPRYETTVFMFPSNVEEKIAYVEDCPINDPSPTQSVALQHSDSDLDFILQKEQARLQKLEKLVEIREKARRLEKLYLSEEKNQPSAQASNNVSRSVTDYSNESTVCAETPEEDEVPEVTKKRKKKPALELFEDEDDDADMSSPAMKKKKCLEYTPTPIAELERRKRLEEEKREQEIRERKKREELAIQKNNQLIEERKRKEKMALKKLKEETLPKEKKDDKPEVKSAKIVEELRKKKHAIATLEKLSIATTSKTVTDRDTVLKKPAASFVHSFNPALAKSSSSSMSNCKSSLVPTKVQHTISTETDIDYDITEKGKQRTAHAPKASPSLTLIGGKPQPIRSKRLLSSTITWNQRVHFVNVLFEAFSKVDPATAAEQVRNHTHIKIRPPKKNTKFLNQQRRQNRIVLKNIADMAISGDKSQQAATKPQKVSHNSNLTGGACVTIGSQNRRPSVQLTEHDIYNNLKKNFLLTPEQLQKNCYPMWTDSTKELVIIPQSHWDTAPGKAGKDQNFVDDFELSRVCSRCGTNFQLNKDGEIVLGRCVFHPLRMCKKRENKALVSRYGCCNGPVDDMGCEIAKAHVSESLRRRELMRFSELDAAVDEHDERSRKVLALDCEMVYTVWGPALARLTVIDTNQKVVLDAKVKPEAAIIDSNQRFSGLTIEEIEKEGRPYDEVLRDLRKIANRKTILMGHSLESDFKAMRLGSSHRQHNILVHKRVVDTALVFPHPAGDTFKRALKDLASDVLQLIIQEDVGGHDSAEDARTCMRLMLKKLQSKASS